MSEYMVRFGMSLPGKLMERFDAHIEARGYGNRSEAIRDLIRRELVEEEIEADEAVLGVLHILYDHSRRELTEKLTEIQHAHHEHIISSMHVHLDHVNCLEVIIIKGTPKRIRKTADRMLAEKGVKHGKLYLTSDGKDLD